MRNDLDDVVSVALVERKRGGVVDGSLQANRTALRGTQPILGGIEQGGADAMAASFAANVNRDDVSHAATALLGDYKPKNRLMAERLAFCQRSVAREMQILFPGFHHQRKSTRTAQVNLQLIAAVGDFRIKA